jgi:N-acetylmuramoyl-L-alanine amidase
MKKVWKWLITIPFIIGMIFAIWFTASENLLSVTDSQKLDNVFGVVVTKPAKITKFYTYGTSINIEGIISGVSKDNYEGIKIIVTDGGEFSKEYETTASFEDGNLAFLSSASMNNAINLEELENGNKYYVVARLQVNNSKDYKYYLFENDSEYEDIEYYSLTKEEKNNKIDIKFDTQEYDEKTYSYLGITVTESALPKNVYDIVIDAGHGGADKGVSSGKYTEADITLEYAKTLKNQLEEKGYKVKLTRDDSNSSSYTYYNMYDDDGRISVACKTQAKYMISLHTNDDGANGVEVYAPNNCDLSLAKQIADGICNSSSLSYSTSTSYKEASGVYVRNFRQADITSFSASLKAKGIEPYTITTSTPYLYTIREVGGIATNAYVDGRNTSYSANKYYNSNQGIECYQVSLGNIKNEIDTLLNEETAIVNAIASVF